MAGLIELGTLLDFFCGRVGIADSRRCSRLGMKGDDWALHSLKRQRTSWVRGELERQRWVSVVGTNGCPK